MTIDYPTAFFPADPAADALLSPAAGSGAGGAGKKQVAKKAPAKKAGAKKATTKAAPAAKKAAGTKAAKATKKVPVKKAPKKAPAKKAAAKGSVPAAQAAPAARPMMEDSAPVPAPRPAPAAVTAAPVPAPAQAPAPAPILKPRDFGQPASAPQRPAAQPPHQAPRPPQNQPQSPQQHQRPQQANPPHQPRPPQQQQNQNQQPHQRPARPPQQQSQQGHQRPPQQGQHQRGQQPRPQQPPQGRPASPVPAPARPADTNGAAPERKVAGADSEAAVAKNLDEIFDKSMTFADLGLRESVLKGVTEAGFVHPTKIQAMLIPPILAGKDVLGQAKTGTGKTASFALPMLNLVEKGMPFQALILVPTRELAIQVDSDIRRLGKHTPIRSLPVYGGQNIRTQADRLHQGAEIIVATPGRIMDMAQRGYIHYKNIRHVILDEVDRMLDIGFRDDIRRILRSCPDKRQTVFVSATISGEIENLARSFAPSAQKVIATAGSLTVSMVKQVYLAVEPWDKRRLLAHLLTHEEPALTLVFCRMKRTVDDVADYLRRKNIDAHAIHGDMQQSSRNRVIEKLRGGNLTVLIASDLASRGLDVEGISHVINYDLPEDPDIYVHRIGRTARAGRAGVAWSFVTPEQGSLLTEIELLINAEIPKLDYPDFEPGPVPSNVIAGRALDAARAEKAKQFNRYNTTATPNIGHVASHSPADADPTRFPGGIVPTKMPPKRFGGRVKSARSMKQAIAQTFMPPAQPTPQVP